MWPMSWWRWTCSERGACSCNLPRPSSLWAEETLFLPVFTFFWGLFGSPILFAATGQQPTCSWFPFSAEQLDSFVFFLSLWIYLWLAETSQQPISQTTWLKVTPHCNHCNHLHLIVYSVLNKAPSLTVSTTFLNSTARTQIWTQAFNAKEWRT